VLLVIGVPMANRVRIPGGLDPSWSWCLAVAVGLIPLGVWGYSASSRAHRLLRLVACGVALLSLGMLLIEHYAFTHWEEPLRYGLHPNVPWPARGELMKIIRTCLAR
jgi:hypothetical protein